MHGCGVGLAINEERDDVPGHCTETLQVRVPMAGHTVLVGRSRIIEDPSLLVRLVTVHTGRNLVGFLFPEPSLDDLYVHGLDAGVACGACGRHVVMGDAGSWVGVREDVVRCMA
jgi:hypothetical protein